MMVILIPILATALFYLSARAEITRPLWSRYGKGFFAELMNCSACTGTWNGGILAVLFCTVGGYDFGPVPAAKWYVPLVSAGLCMVVVPLLAYAQTWALVGMMDPEDPEEDPDDVHD